SYGMTRIATLALIASLACGLAAPGRAGAEKLKQCRYDAPALTTCSGLMGEDAFPYTDEKICARKQPGYLIVAHAGGMHKYAVETRRHGDAKPVYRLGTSGFTKAQFSFALDGAMHVVGDDMMLVIRHGKNSVVEVWKRGACKTVDIDVEALEGDAAKAGTGR